MCLVIVQNKPGVRVKKQSLVNAYNNNPHGCGIAGIDDGVLKVWKGMPDFASFYATYLDVVNLKSPMLVHFRFCTQGEYNIDNLHPFGVYKDMVFVHNGVIKMPNDDTKSDTALFNDDVLRKIPRETYELPGVWRMMELAIGKSMLAFLFADGRTNIVNEFHGGHGHWNQGHSVYFSNNSYDNPNYFSQCADDSTHCGTCAKKLKHEPEHMIHQPVCDACLDGENVNNTE